MSNSRQGAEAGVLVRFWTLDHHRAEQVTAPPSTWPMLVFAESGALFLDVGDRRWTLPANRALPVPAGERITMQALAPVRVRSLFFGPDWEFDLPPTPIEVSPLLREVIVAVCARGPLRSSEPEDAAWAVVLRGELARAPRRPTGLPWPRSAWLREMAAAAMTESGDLGTLVARTGYSRRTVERAVQAETRLSLGRWLRQARLLRALATLGTGGNVTDASIGAGYAEPSAFIQAFKRAFGTTPGSFRE